MKSYQESFVLLMATTLKDITNHSLKDLFTSLSHLKPIPHFIPMLSSILELLKLVRNSLPPLTEKEKPYYKQQTQILHLLKLQVIINCAVNCLMYANSISTINTIFNIF